MRHALIAAIVSAVVASAGASAYTPPTTTDLDMRVQYLEEQMAMDQIGDTAYIANTDRKIRQLGRCMAKPDALEVGCLERHLLVRTR